MWSVSQSIIPAHVLGYIDRKNCYGKMSFHYLGPGQILIREEFWFFRVSSPPKDMQAWAQVVDNM